MKLFVLGVVVGLLVGAGGAWVVLRAASTSGAEVAEADAGPKGGEGKKKGGRRGARSPRGGGESGEGGDDLPPPPELGEGDLRMVAEGDRLAMKPRQMDFGEGAPEPRNLSQDEIDSAIGGKAQAIIGCITDARGQAALAGRVTVGFVVTAEGGVSQTRVEAPAYLMENGLSRCVRPKLAAMRFPATGKDTVVHVPFDVE